MRENLVAVIGAGHWGPHYLRIFSMMPGVRVGLCCDRDPGRLSEISTLYPFIPTSTDPEMIYSSDEIDAVVIATPASTHVEIGEAALRAGKDVLVEKPISLDSGEGMKLVEAAEKHERVLMVNHTFLYNPGIRKMKELVDNDTLGQIYYLHATRTHLGLIRNDVDVLWDLAPHDISIFSYILGSQPMGVSAVGRSFLKEGRHDVAFATVFYPEDVFANIHVSWIDSNKERSVVVVGSERRVVFDDLNNLESIKIFEKGVSVEKPVTDFGEFQLLLRDGDIITSPREIKLCYLVFRTHINESDLNRHEKFLLREAARFNYARRVFRNLVGRTLAKLRLPFLEPLYQKAFPRLQNPLSLLKRSSRETRKPGLR